MAASSSSSSSFSSSSPSFSWVIPYGVEASFSGLPGVSSVAFLYVWEPQAVSALADLSSLVGVMENQGTSFALPLNF